MWRHTWVLMGPDSNEMLKPGFPGLVVYGNNRNRNRLKRKIKVEKDHGHSKQIKSNNFTVSLLGQEKGKTYLFSTATKAVNSYTPEKAEY